MTTIYVLSSTGRLYLQPIVLMKVERSQCLSSLLYTIVCLCSFFGQLRDGVKRNADIASSPYKDQTTVNKQYLLCYTLIFQLTNSTLQTSAFC